MRKLFLSLISFFATFFICGLSLAKYSVHVGVSSRTGDVVKAAPVVGFSMAVSDKVSLRGSAAYDYGKNTFKKGEKPVPANPLEMDDGLFVSSGLLVASLSATLLGAVPVGATLFALGMPQAMTDLSSSHHLLTDEYGGFGFGVKLDYNLMRTSLKGRTLRSFFSGGLSYNLGVSRQVMIDTDFWFDDVLEVALRGDYFGVNLGFGLEASLSQKLSLFIEGGLEKGIRSKVEGFILVHANTSAEDIGGGVFEEGSYGGDEVVVKGNVSAKLPIHPFLSANFRYSF